MLDSPTQATLAVFRAPLFLSSWLRRPSSAAAGAALSVLLGVASRGTALPTTALPATALPANPVASDEAAIELRLVQVDLSRIASIERAEGATVKPGSSWGFSFGVSIDGGVRWKPPVFELGDQGELRIGDRVWALGAALDDAERGIVQPDSPFTVLSAPRVVCRVGEDAILSIGTPIEWLVLDDEGCLRRADERDGPLVQEGVEIRLRLTLANDDAIELAPMDVTLRQMVGRETVSDLALDVGKPILRERRIHRDVRVLRDRVAIIPIVLDLESDEDPIFVVISRNS